MQTSSANTTPTLPFLADDIVANICQKAGPRTTAMLSCVNHELGRVAASPHLWRAFSQPYLGATPALPNDAARSAFAQAVPAAVNRLAAKACLGSFDDERVYLVSFPDDTDTPRIVIDMLAETAKSMDRPFSLVDATRVHAWRDLAHLGPNDFCVFENIDAAFAKSTSIIASFVDAAARVPGRKVVLLHGDDLDTCDANLLQRVPQPLTYRLTPANFRIDPIAAAPSVPKSQTSVFSVSYGTAR